VWKINLIGTYLFASVSLLKMCGTRNKQFPYSVRFTFKEHSGGEWILYWFTVQFWACIWMCTWTWSCTHTHTHTHTHKQIYIPNAFFFLKTCLPVLSCLVPASGSKHAVHWQLCHFWLLISLLVCSTHLLVCLLITSWLKIRTYIHISWFVV
jgi:hypothetical protein